MANVLVLGGGFGGVVAAERLAELLAPEHQITLVSRSSRFVFYPALVRLAFDICKPGDVSFDLRETMMDRRVRFVQSEVAGVDVQGRYVRLTGGEVEGQVPYDYLVFAVGRRLATERVPGFFEYAEHLLTVEAALKFGARVREFQEGSAVIGYCEGSRLAVPVYETAFALARMLEERGERGRAKITVVSPEPRGGGPEGRELGKALESALDSHYIVTVPRFSISRVTPDSVQTSSGLKIGYDLLMLVPPFHGPGASYGFEAGDDGYIPVDRQMRVTGIERVYAVGDCAQLPGPKTAHMAVNQALVAALNVAAEVEGSAPAATYDHDLSMVIDEGGPESIYFHKEFRDGGESVVRQGRFWRWAKLVQERYWEARHL